MVPHAVPAHPVPPKPLETDQFTARFEVPLTRAVNWIWLGADPDGGRKAFAGEIVTLEDAPPACTILICALALCDESATLVAVSSTGFCPGAAAGAR